MKQIEECLERAFSKKEPLKKKWKAFIREKENIKILYIYHYQHLILTVIIDYKQIYSAWYQTNTDKRGLISCCEYLIKKNIITKEHFQDIFSKIK